MLSISIKILRFSLAFVFVWFGLLKLLNVSPVFDVIASAYPFITAHPIFYLGLALGEILLGIGILIPRFLRVACWLMILHLVFATLGVLFSPQAFNGSFPLLSIVGEFVVKNLVLMAAAFVVSS